MASPYKIVTQVLEDRAPRAVALVIGGLGQTTDSVRDTFSKVIYPDCTTISAASPPSDFFRHRLAPTAASVIQEVAKQLRETNERTPLVVHVFSNGGAIVLEQMEALMNTAGQEKSPVVKEDAELIQTRLGYQFFDSSPCYLHEIWSPSALGRAFPNNRWNGITRGIYYLGSAASLSAWNTVTLSLHRPRQFWRRMENSPARHQIYAYTTADMLSDAFKVEELIDVRRKKGVNVTVLKFEDADHCSLLRHHPQEYKDVVENALSSAISRLGQS